MRKLAIIGIILTWAVGTISTTFAQELKPAPKELKAVITSEDFLPLEKKNLFDASDSNLLSAEDTKVDYIWNFGDGSPQQIGKEVIHTFKETGNYEVSLTVQDQGQKNQTNKVIYIYDRKGLLITDTNKETELQEIKEEALNYGIWLKLITPATENSGLSSEEDIVNQISAESDYIKNTDIIISYTKSNTGLQAFTRFWQKFENKENLKLEDKLLVNVTDENFGTAARLSEQSFSVFHPKFILLTRKEAFHPIFQTKSAGELINTLNQRGIEYNIIDDRSQSPGYFFLSKLISNFIAHGISTNTLYLILVLPFITFLICFGRQVIGISTFGVYTPTVLTLSFLVMGIMFGMSVLLIVILVSYILRIFFERTHLLYIPKVALLISLLSFAFLGIIWFVLYTESNISIALAIFPMMVMSTMSEKFISTQSEEGIKSAFLATLETIVVCIIAYYLVTLNYFSNLIISLPELIILPILATLMLGKFSGLRLTEYFRFRSIVKSDSEE